ncbi:alpha-1,2-fucosyltransferase [Dysgonomonas sp. ZJ709]|uniref:alpha-1,2-fucosyltransferase n=1 Tax=Dysgonomonas sp. ZJ709 TaxID=2709797 RepID=UPI0013EADE3F|nr:alpha-1,2-fucosyltransferase [Dysgonomonas sp. ZJ709]
MKIVVFKGGLGNQIFEYAFCQYLKTLINEKIYVYYVPEKKAIQRRFEIMDFFDAKINKAHLIIKLVYWLIKVIKYMYKDSDLISTDDSYNINSICFDGWWQDKKYYENINSWIQFKNLPLNDKNIETMNAIKNTESVSIHIRRGDYLFSQFADIYTNICTPDYYRNAISMVKQKYKNPHFFVFSDDMDWVKENFELENATYISWNVGIDSHWDMYLMSYCKVNIIANSSFSYWGAYLNKSNELTVYPQKWYNSGYEPPSIFPEKWYGI